MAEVELTNGDILEVPDDWGPDQIKVAVTKIQTQAAPQDGLTDAAKQWLKSQANSLTNFPDLQKFKESVTTPEATKEMVNTVAMMGIPAGVVNNAGRRIALGAATGASKGDDIESKLEGAAKGGAFALAVEGVPAIQAMATMGKRRFIDPVFSGERVVGATLKRFAEDPNNPQVLDRTVMAIQNPKQFVRGSNPTTAQASGNAGLWGLDKAVMAREQSAYKALEDTQNLARVKALKELGIGEGARKQGDAIKKEAVQLLDKAMKAQKVWTPSQLSKATPEELARDYSAINLKPVEKTIDQILSGGAGKQSQVQSALSKLKNLLRDKSGNLETQLDQIQGIRNEIGTMLSGKLAGDAGNVRFAAGEVGQVKTALDDAIEQALANSGNSGLHRAFVQKYRQGATINNRADLMENLLKRSSTTGQVPEIGMIAERQFGPTGVYQPGEVLSAAKLANFLKSDAWKKGSKNLTPAQVQRVKDVQKDLLRAVPRDIKRGSDTYQNLTADYLMQDIFGPGGGGNTVLGGMTQRAIGGLGGLLENLPFGIGSGLRAAIPSANPLENPELRQILLRAMQDPGYAAGLLNSYRSTGLLTSDLPARFSGFAIPGRDERPGLLQ